MLGIYQSVLKQINRQARVRGYSIAEIVNKNWGNTKKFVAINPFTGDHQIIYCICGLSRRRLISMIDYERVINEPTVLLPETLEVAA